MQNEATVIRCRLDGIRPIMFDRYAGDNSTQLPVAERMYLDDRKRLVVPSLNLYSLLCAENTKSVCRQFFGKQGKTIALGIASYTMIPEMNLALLGAEDNPIEFTGFGGQVVVHTAVARVKGGIPNPKQRPMVNLPWSLEFDIHYRENKYCTVNNLRQAFEMGGTLGLGTFRPFFGAYTLTKWEESK